MRNRSLRIWVTVALAVCLVIAATSCKRLTPEEQAQKILGECKKEDSDGAYKLSMNDDNTWLTITYHYTPLGRTSLKEEIGRHLGYKVRDIFKEVSSLETLQFVVQRPYRDTKGNLAWDKFAHFTFTREIYDSINWDNFLTADLLDVAERPWTSDSED